MAVGSPCGCWALVARVGGAAAEPTGSLAVPPVISSTRSTFPARDSF